MSVAGSAGANGSTTQKLVVGANLPPSAIPSEYLRVQSHHKVYHSTLPDELEDLNAIEWRDSLCLKNCFKTPKKGRQRVDQATPMRFPYCLLVFGPASTSAHQRLIVVNWWLNLTKDEQKSTWTRLNRLFLRPNLSAELMTRQHDPENAKCTGKLNSSAPHKNSLHENLIKNDKSRQNMENTSIAMSTSDPLPLEVFAAKRGLNLEYLKRSSKEDFLKWSKNETKANLFQHAMNIQAFKKLIKETPAIGIDSLEALCDQVDASPDDVLALDLHNFGKLSMMMKVELTNYSKILAEYKENQNKKRQSMSASASIKEDNPLFREGFLKGYVVGATKKRNPPPNGVAGRIAGSTAPTKKLCVEPTEVELKLAREECELAKQEAEVELEKAKQERRKAIQEIELEY